MMALFISKCEFGYDLEEVVIKVKDAVSRILKKVQRSCCVDLCC
jgi:hypothetical protein